MAYMAAQFLKGGRSFHPIPVQINDNRHSHPEYFFKYFPNKREFNLAANIAYELSFDNERGKSQELCLTQPEVEYLLEGLLLKTAIDISPEIKVKLMKLLSFETEEEVFDYLKENK